MYIYGFAYNLILGGNPWAVSDPIFHGQKGSEGRVEDFYTPHGHMFGLLIKRFNIPLSLLFSRIKQIANSIIIYIKNRLF